MRKMLKRIFSSVFALLIVMNLITAPSTASARRAVGDVNLDGYINEKDGDLLMQYLTGDVEFSMRQILSADIDFDGELTVRDAVQLYRYVTGTEKVLPIVSFLKLQVKSLPKKTVYSEGEQFSMDGFEAVMVYSDGTEEAFTDYSWSGYSSDSGTKVITVTNGTVYTAFTVEVKEKKVVDFELEALPIRLSYNPDEELNTYGMKAVAHYSDGTSSRVESGYTVSGYEAKVGTNKVTVFYRGFSDSFDVNVAEGQTSIPAIVQSGGSRLNCRTGPGTDYPSAGLFTEGQTVELLDTTNYDGWYYVSGVSTRGTVISGYCYADYIIPVK